MACLKSFVCAFDSNRKVSVVKNLFNWKVGLSSGFEAMCSKRLAECCKPFRTFLHTRKSKTLCGIKTCHGLTGLWSYNGSCTPLPASGQLTTTKDTMQINLNSFIRHYSKLGTKATKTGAIGPSENVEVGRIMLPDDANVVGNVHGGTTLSMIEQAGFVAATRHCNSAPTSDKDKPLLGALARVERTDFLQPMYIGELAKLQAKVTYTSAHSIEVTADVWAENLTTGEVRKTNHAILWYVAIEAPDESLHYSKTLTPVAVPPCTSLTDEEQRKGQARYEYQKQDQLNGKQIDPLVLKACDSSSAEVGTPDHSQSALVHLVLPSDCLTSGHMQGGVLMKLMDECAVIVAARHCRTNVVTISLDAINFISPVVNGELVTLRGRVTFASERSMEIAVTVQAEGMAIGNRRSTNTAYFTYVSVPKGSHQAQKIPPLILVTEKHKKMFEDGKKRHLARKEMRKLQQ